MGWQSDDAELGNDDDALVSSISWSASASVVSSTAAALVRSTSKYNLSTDKGGEAFL